MREKFHWQATLQRDDGEIVTRPVATFWRPDAEDASEAVARTAAAEAYMASGKQYKFAAISATRAAA